VYRPTRVLRSFLLSNKDEALLALPVNSVCLVSVSVSMKTTPIVAVSRLRPDFGVCVETEIWDDVSRQIPRQRPEYRSLAFLLRLRSWMNFRGQDLEPDQSLDLELNFRDRELYRDLGRNQTLALVLTIETETKTWDECPRHRPRPRPDLGLYIKNKTWNDFPRR